GKIILYVISSGITALLLNSNKIIHSRFKIPFDVSNPIYYNIKKNINLYKFIK
ncbi:hypothetical protein B0T20DRAFT_347675, partial [Sordaria brevicollis]